MSWGRGSGVSSRGSEKLAGVARVPTVMRFTPLFLSLPLLVACQEAEPEDSAGPDGVGGRMEGAAGARGTIGFCPPDPPSDALEVNTVKGKLVDESGVGLADLQTTVCGVQCFDGRTDDEGRFAVEVGCRLELGSYSLVPHGRPAWAAFYFPLPTSAPGGTVSLGALPMLALPASGPVLVVKTDEAGAPAQTVRSAGVTLDVPAGVRIDLEIDDVFAGDLGKMFRVRRVPDAVLTELVPDSLGVRVAYAVNPFDATFKDAAAPNQLARARLSFANHANFSPDSPVEVMALGSYLHPDWVTPAAFEVVATGTVRGDGSRIDLDPGEGIEHLNWFALR